MSRRSLAPLAGALLVFAGACGAAKDIAALAPVAENIGKTFGVHQVNLGRTGDTLAIHLPDSTLVALAPESLADTARAIGSYAIRALPPSYRVREVTVVFGDESKAGGVKITNSAAGTRYHFHATELGGGGAASN